MTALRHRLPSLPGERFGDLAVEAADDFAYHDPVDGSVSEAQGVRIMFSGGARIVFRLSGTGTSGATLRVYLEAYEPDAGRQDREPREALEGLIEAADRIAGISRRTGRDRPDVVT